MIAKTKVLVTGGAGFIGSNLAEYLVGKGFQVTILDNLSTGKLENIQHLLEDVTFRKGDICDRETVLDCMSGIDYVFHQAALPSVPRSIKDPYTTNRVNIEGTLNLLLAAKEAGVKRFIYASSSSVYGNTEALPKIENMPVYPSSPYALTKYTGERYCQLFYELYGLETVCLRYFNVFGPRQDPHSQYAAVIPKFINQIMKGGPITVYGDGSQTRDFTYVQNVIEANYLAVVSPEVPGEILNIAYGTRISVNDLAQFLLEEMGSNVRITYLEERKGEVKHSQASIEKAKNIIGYNPRIDVREGLRKTIEFLISA